MLLLVKHAPNARAALAALTSLGASVQGTDQAIIMQFQGLSVPSSASVFGTIGNQAVMGNSVAGVPANGSNVSAPNLKNTSSSGSQQAGNQNGNQNSVTSAINKAANKLKKKPPF